MNRSFWQSRAGSAIIFWVSAITALFYFHLLFGEFFPNNQGMMGVDYTYFTPRLLDGIYWRHVNGPWAVPWFTPSFCGGLPFFGNPQSMYYSVPQALAIMFGPFRGIYYTFLIFALAGFGGFYLLLRGAFGVSRPIAMLGAALFMFNGFYSYRMLVGHLAFHAYQLIPLACYFLLRPLPERGEGRIPRFMLDAAAAGVLFAMMIHSGMLELGLPVGLSVVLAGAIAGLFIGKDGEFWGRFILASILALMLGAARLNATLAFMAQFERSMYDFPGQIRSLTQVAWLLGQTIFLWPDKMLIHGARFWIGAKSFFHDRQCYEFSVTIVPLLLGMAGAYSVAKNSLAAGRGGGLSRGVILNLLLALISVMVVVSLLYSFPDPRWGKFLKQIPIVKTYFNLTPWISSLIPAAILFPLVLFDRTIRLQGAPLMAVTAACLLIAASQAWFRDNSFYHGQFYDFRKIEAAYERLTEGAASPEIAAMADQSRSNWEHALQKRAPMGGDDYLAQNESQINCYEPIFGYKMERFPQGKLTPGPAMEEREGLLNIKNPACYSYPLENGCAPGDHFRPEQRELAEKFRKYQPFAFEAPARQKAANAITLTALGLIIALVAHRLLSALKTIGRLGKNSAK